MLKTSMFCAGIIKREATVKRGGGRGHAVIVRRAKATAQSNEAYMRLAVRERGYS